MTAPRDPRENLLLTCSGYCALCRETLPDPQARYVPPPNDAWKYKVVGLYNTGDTGMPPFIVALLGDLHTDSLPSKELVVNFGVRRQYSTIKVSLKYRSDKDRIAHIVHLACWNLIKKLDPKLTRRSIYEFAESTYSLFNTIHVPEGQDIKTEGFTGAVNENSSRTDLGELLNHVSRLPLELQIQISDECPSNLLSSLVAVARTSSTLVSAFKSGRGQRYIELISHSEVKTLCAKFVSIFGNKYISSLGFNEPNEDSGTVLVKASKITGIKFAIGRYGIKALRICYASNELSEWLGDPRDGWLGVIYGSDIGRLRILCDVSLNTRSMPLGAY
ncbi:hypothetical protein V494_00173 [Pseudogymnoascus sp. VKM F-4513 (FW-928)]|nr:hypothetical protein V494_00173 [Pseudogymnoascus sp. VKM F-4513 (FW-928)]